MRITGHCEQSINPRTPNQSAPHPLTDMKNSILNLFISIFISPITLRVIDRVDGEDIFDWSTDAPQQEYPEKPDLPTNTVIHLDLYEVQTHKPNQVTLMYRHDEHDGLASENYTLLNPNQAFVADSWRKRFSFPQFSKSNFEADFKAHMKSLEGQQIPVVLDPRESADEIYNVNPIESAKRFKS